MRKCTKKFAAHAQNKKNLLRLLLWWFQKFAFHVILQIVFILSLLFLGVMEGRGDYIKPATKHTSILFKVELLAFVAY